MNFRVDRHALLEAVASVMPLVSSRSTKPILSMIKVQAASDGLEVMATDMEAGMVCKIAANVKQGGAIMLPPQKLTQILRESADESIEIAGDDSIIRLKMNRSKFEFTVYNADEFPNVSQEIVGGTSFVVNGAVLAERLKVVLPAVEKKESTKWAITGVHFEFKDNYLSLVGTDTRQLVYIRVPCTGEGSANVTVPTRSIAALVGMMSKEDVTITVHKNDILFSTDGNVLTSRTLEGRYPPYRDIIPKNLNIKSEFDADQLLGALKQSLAIADNESKRTTMEFGTDGITVTATSANGAAEIAVGCSAHSGAGVQVDIDGTYVVNYLRSVSGVTTAHMRDGSSPVVFRHGEDHTCLVMPLVS